MVEATSTKKEIFCDWENLTMSCGADEVVVVEAVRYGRMEIGNRYLGKEGSCTLIVYNVFQE